METRGGSPADGRGGWAAGEPGGEALGTSLRTRLRRHRIALGALILAVLIVGWGAGAAVQVLSARRAVGAAEQAAREAGELAASGELEEAGDRLRRALDHLDSARSALASPWVSPLRLIPYAGTELRAARAGVAGVESGSLAVLGLIDFAVADRAPVYADGRLEPAGLEALGRALADALDHTGDARAVLESAPRPRLGLVERRLEEARRVTSDLLTVLSGARPLVDRLAEAAAGGAPYRLLLLLENGAERRATGGLVGWYALVEVDREGVGLPAFGSVVGALQARDADGELLSVEAPADYLERYGDYQANTTLWANVNLSPDFPTVGGVARRLYLAATGVEVDAVARIDLVGLGYLLGAFPGLTVEGRELDGSTLATDFVIDSYRRFPDDTRPGEQNAYLGEVMEEVVGQLLGGTQADRGEVLGALRRAVAERRVSMVTGEAAVDAMLATAGADGGVLPGNPGDLMVTTQNLAMNKVDLFTETDLTVRLSTAGCRVEGEISVTLTNALPGDMDWLPHWTLGSAGRWLVSVYLPPGASVLDLEVDGMSAPGTFLQELGRTVASVVVDAQAGESVGVTVRWQEQVPGPGYALTLQPQPLIVPATLAIGGEPSVPFMETRVREFADVCGG